MMWCLDIEASGLNLNVSYPIEIGYTNGEQENSFLIVPYEDWWYWDPAAQEVHGITRSELFTDGISGSDACEILNRELANQEVYVDGGWYDEYWLQTLYAEANMMPTFRLQYVSHHYTDGTIIEHRALADARQLLEYLQTKED